MVEDERTLTIAARGGVETANHTSHDTTYIHAGRRGGSWRLP